MEQNLTNLNLNELGVVKIITKFIQLHNLHYEHNDQVNKFKKLHEQIKANILDKNMMQV